jgi:dTDP-4-amino-4,6-dideoxygalactose transaminase
MKMSKLALLGGEKAVKKNVPDEMFHWPIVNKEMKEAVVAVLEDGNMSGLDISKKFEAGFAEWHGSKYALAHSSGTASLHTAMYGVGLGVGDELICPSITYWASCAQALNLGASVVFADIDPYSLCLDPDDFERKITKRTKAVVVVHYLSYPADMDRIMQIAKKHNIKVIEDCSHSHGSLYKGKMTGTIGDVAGFSCMTGKSFAIGEGGMLLTNNREIYERGLLFGHYARHDEIENEELKKRIYLPNGGFKYRMHQMSAAVGLEQLKKYNAEIAEIDKIFTYFWDNLEGSPGIHAHRPANNSGSTKGGWYIPVGLYEAEEFEGLSCKRFCEALTAEGMTSKPGVNAPLHNHPLFSTVDVYNHGRSTNSANLPADVKNRGDQQELPVASKLRQRIFQLPYMKHFDKELIDQYITAIKKVCSNYADLLEGDTDTDIQDSWNLTKRKV